jgi:hypothetical protein
MALGYGTLREDRPTEFRLSDHGQDTDIGITIDKTARDAGNTPTTTLRKGLVIGKITATGKYAQYNDAANDGTQVARCILADEVNLLDEEGTAQDGHSVGVIHGVVEEAKLIGLDANGKADLTHVIFR